MPVPDTTSAESLDRYAVGQKTAGGKGPAWKDVKVSVLALPPAAGPFTMPAVTEPLIVWTTSGEAETQERENNGPWLTSHVKKNSLFLTAAGAPYDFQYRTLSSEPYEVVLVLISLPLFNEALREVFGTNAANTRLRDLSGFEDPELTALIRPLRDEALRAHSSRLVVRGLGQAIAVHLARHYTAVIDGVRGAASSLPGFKLKRVTDWMAEHLEEDFSLARLAEQAQMSEFHFNRLFKRATGVPPSQYHIKLRLDAARRLLRETQKSVITIANEVGYSNPSHFAQLFRKETGLSPTHYRRQL